MKTKKILTVVASVAMAAAMSITSFAYGWQQNSNGWWYATDADNTTCYANGWQWLDGNNDGIYECYCFAPDGYIYVDTVTPDGYTVDANGAWTVDGAVQTKGQAASYDVVSTADGLEVGDVDSIARWLGDHYNSNNSACITLGIGVNGNIAAFYSSDSIEGRMYDFVPQSDGTYKASSARLALNSDGSVTFNGKIFY